MMSIIKPRFVMMERAVIILGLSPWQERLRWSVIARWSLPEGRASLESVPGRLADFTDHAACNCVAI